MQIASLRVDGSNFKPTCKLPVGIGLTDSAGNITTSTITNHVSECDESGLEYQGDGIAVGQGERVLDPRVADAHDEDATPDERVRIGEHSVVRARWGAEWRCVDFDLGRRGRVWVWRVAPCGAVGQGECVRGDFE